MPGDCTKAIFSQVQVDSFGEEKPRKNVDTSQGKVTADIDKFWENFCANVRRLRRLKSLIKTQNA